MTTWFISRHEGAILWMKEQEGWNVDRWEAHLDVSEVHEGDVVVGTLPLHLAAEVCQKGAYFYFLILPQQEFNRGCEYSATQMNAAGCRLQQYDVKAI